MGDVHKLFALCLFGCERVWIDLVKIYICHMNLCSFCTLLRFPLFLEYSQAASQYIVTGGNEAWILCFITRCRHSFDFTIFSVILWEDIWFFYSLTVTFGGRLHFQLLFLGLIATEKERYKQQRQGVPCFSLQKQTNHFSTIKQASANKNEDEKYNKTSINDKHMIMN